VSRTQTYHLNLPTKITFAGNKEIAYTYDAAGTKLSKTATQNGTAISQTDYVNGHIYQDGQLEFFGMPEGRMYAQRDANGNFEALKPEYHLTDHLGNLRVAWRPEQAAQTNSFMMTAEPENKADEDTTFQNLAEAPRAKGFESPTAVSLSQYDPAIKKEFIPLEEGQEVEVSVLGLREILQSTEEESDIPTSTGKTKNGIVPVPIIINGTNTHNSGDVAKQGSVRFNALGIIPFAKKLFSKKEQPQMAVAPKPLPEGELVISFYDSTKELLSTEILSLKSENEWETLAFSAKADEKGFVSASIRGTSAKPVSFDNFQIETRATYTAKLYQENHYYPFGMNMKGLESSDKQSVQNKKEHEFQFNSQTEREEEFGLYWDETPFRNYDSQLGRLWGVDKMAETMPSMTPFHYGFNNPTSFNDPTGLFPIGGYIRLFFKKMAARLQGNPNAVQIYYGKGKNLKLRSKTAKQRRRRKKKSKKLEPVRETVYDENINVTPTFPGVGVGRMASMYSGEGVRSNNEASKLTPDDKRHIIIGTPSTVTYQSVPTNFTETRKVDGGNSPYVTPALNFHLSDDNKSVSVSLYPNNWRHSSYVAIDDQFGVVGAILPVSVRLVLAVELKITKYPKNNLFAKRRYSISAWPHKPTHYRIMGRKKLNSEIREWRNYWREKAFN